MAVNPVVLEDLTTGALAGTGVFDALMRASKVHLDVEFNADRIRGPEYSTVYLGQLESSMQTAMSFLMQRQKISLEAKLLEVQVRLAEVEVLKANAQLDLVREQVLTAGIERTLLEAQADKVRAEMELIPLQKLQLEAQTALTVQQKLNAVTENTVLIAQECKLRAEFDYTVQNTQKTASEVNLLVQKIATEKAQILSLGVDDDSVIGKQKKLYEAQTVGFKRDAEQKAAGLYIDVWKTLRMTDDAWQANQTQGLDDATMGQVLALLRQGVGVPAS